MSRPILFEVIATGVSDASAAVAGGADRLELVRDMAADGLTPSRETFAAVRAAVDVPLRVMLRQRHDFGAGDPNDLDALCRQAEALRALGADEFVFGFLSGHGDVDITACRAVLHTIGDSAWTFHRALDQVSNRESSRQLLADLPGLDTVLSAGAPTGVGDGTSVLRAEASRHGQPGYTPRLLVGGGLAPRHLPALRTAGVDAFHVGSAVRRGRQWDAPVDSALVRLWRDRLDAPTATTG